MASARSAGPAAPASDPGRGAGRPRSRDVDRRVLEATLAVVRERGPDAVTIEAVAEASGSAKTTIYRRYRNRDELLAAALDSLVTEVSTAQTGTNEERLAAMLDSFRRGVEEQIGLPAVGRLLAGDDAAFARTLRRRVLQPRLTALAAVVADAQVAGEVRSDADPTEVVLAVAGSYFAEMIITGEVGSDWPDRALATVGFGHKPGAGRAVGPRPPAPPA